MTPIIGITASSITPFTLGDFESIATVTVGSGGAANVDFTSIPGTYQHLQIRITARSDEASTADTNGNIRFNSDSGSNYARHQLYGDGSGTGSTAITSATQAQVINITASTATASIFGIAVIDILDYANTNKYTTIRSLTGQDRNGAGLVIMRSGLWMNSNAVTDIRLFSTSGNWVQHSHFALYGIKG